MAHVEPSTMKAAAAERAQAAGDELAPAPRGGLRQRWQHVAARLSARERAALAAALGLLLLAGVWLGAIAPAWRTLRDAPPRVLRLQEELEQMQRAAAEVQQLRARPALSQAQAREALEAARARLGPAAQLQWQGERAVLVVQRVSPQALAQWLSQVRAEARAQPQQVQLQREGDGLSGTLVLQLSGRS